MKALKTIVATAVIVFALTTVATAGVQHFTKAQGAQAAGQAPVHYAVTLAAKQLPLPMGGRSGSQVTPAQQRIATHARHADGRHNMAHPVRHQAHAQHIHRGPSNGQSTSSGHSGSHHDGPNHPSQASGTGHAGDSGGGGSRCGD